MSDRIPVSASGRTQLATLDEIQAVWGAVTAKPTATLNCLSKQLGVGRSKTYCILRFLEGAGYIRHDCRKAGRVVVIPFVILETWAR